MSAVIQLAEQGKLPDPLIRLGIRHLLKQRLARLQADAGDDTDGYVRSLVDRLANTDVALDTDEANAQHYECPVWFFKSILGPRLKYSSCYFDDEADGLAEAEEDMLRLTAERAELADGQRILELGCGWGSLSLWMAEHYPNTEITVVTNSATQADYVQQLAAERNASGLRVVKCDINRFEPADTFDRIVSVEMFEHVRNYHELFRRISQWLKLEGRLFLHVFSHRSLPYLFEAEGPGDWMAREFFTGGTMPSQDFLPRFTTDLQLEQYWRLNGTHYARTLEAWLQRLDAQRTELRQRFAQEPAEHAPIVMLQRWRMFLMACAELFAFREGTEWGVSHYRFRKEAAA